MLGGASEYTRCPDCGTSVGREILDAELHRCDERHLGEHGVRVAREEADRFEAGLDAWLRTPQGRFAVYYAQRSRR